MAAEDGTRATGEGVGMGMTCAGCTNPYGGIFIAGCRPCTLRDIAMGPHFFASLRAGRLTQEYRAALAPLGEDIAATHAEVRAVAKTLKTGAVPA